MPQICRTTQGLDEKIKGCAFNWQAAGLVHAKSSYEMLFSYSILFWNLCFSEEVQQNTPIVHSFQFLSSSELKSQKEEDKTQLPGGKYAYMHICAHSHMHTCVMGMKIENMS